MITYLDVEDLLDFHAQKQPIISAYLNTDRSRFTLDQQRAAAKNLLREGRRAAQAIPWDDEVKSAITGDLDRLERIFNEELEPTLAHRSLAVFACREANLWRVFGLPRPLPSNLFLENTPHIRPLTLILDEYHRFGALLLDRNRAELYEAYIGEILKLEQAFEHPEPSDLSLHPSPVESPGSGDRGMSHRTEEETQKHFRRVADVLYHTYHRRHWEYLVLGGQQQILAQFENFLHPTLQEQLAGHFSSEPGKTRTSKILEEVAAIERKVETTSEKRLVEQLLNTAGSRGLAVLGLDDVLTALQMGAVHLLLVEEGWRRPGVLCRNCGFLGLTDDKCPSCGEEPAHVADMVEEVIESAIHTGSIIEHVNPQAGLAEHGHIGAILRFKV